MLFLDRNEHQTNQKFEAENQAHRQQALMNLTAHKQDLRDFPIDQKFYFRQVLSVFHQVGRLSHL